MSSTFVHIWNLLVSHGVVPSEIHEAEEYWNGFTLDEQRAIYRAIRDKIRAGKFVNYHPVYAIRDNAPKKPHQGPVNYRGKSKLPKVPIFSAKYNGTWGMYTQADITKFHMELPKD